MKKTIILLFTTLLFAFAPPSGSDKRLDEAVQQALSQGKSGEYYVATLGGGKPVQEKEFNSWRASRQYDYYFDTYQTGNVAFAGYAFTAVVRFSFLPMAEYRQLLERRRLAAEQAERDRLAQIERERQARIKAEQEKERQRVAAEKAEKERKAREEQEQIAREKREAEERRLQEIAGQEKARQIAANSDKSLFKQGSKLCREVNGGVMQTALDSWNEDRSMCKVKIISGPSGNYGGEPIKYDSYIWIKPTDGWHICLDEEIRQSSVNDASRAYLTPKRRYSEVEARMETIEALKYWTQFEGKTLYEKEIVITSSKPVIGQPTVMALGTFKYYSTNCDLVTTDFTVTLQESESGYRYSQVCVRMPSCILWQTNWNWKCNP